MTDEQRQRINDLVMALTPFRLLRVPDIVEQHMGGPVAVTIKHEIQGVDTQRLIMADGSVL